MQTGEPSRPAEGAAAAGIVQDWHEIEFATRLRLADRHFSDDPSFERSVAQVLRGSPELIARWATWSGDQRWTPSAYLEGNEAGWFDGVRRNVKVHPDAASAAADFIHRLAAWLARREVLPPAPTREIWLVTIGPEVPGDEARRWWNSKDAPVLDDLVRDAPRLRLGRVMDDDFDDVPGPARRVFSLLSLRGTIPEYVVPRLDDELIGEILAAYQGRGDDAPATQRATPAEVAAFLAAHRGAGALYDEDETP